MNTRREYISQELPSVKHAYGALGGEYSAGGWKALTERICHEIGAITRHTEEEFLTIGAGLMDFHKRARTISEMSSEVAARMTGPVIVTAIDSMNRLLEKMETYLLRSQNDTATRAETLRHILDLADHSHKSLEAFHLISKALHSVSVIAKVHKAQLMAKDPEFRDFFLDVDRLARTVAEKSDNISEDLSSLQNGITAVLTRLLVFQENQQSNARMCLDRTASVLCSITGQYGLSANTAKNVCRRSEEIVRNVEEIVADIQFHDIARQQFEHIGSAFGSLREILSSPSSPAQSASCAAALDPAMGRFCESHSVGLLRIRDTFVTAVREITDDLLHISVGVRDISGDIQKIAGGNGSHGRTFLEEMEETLSSVKKSFAALSDNAERSRELADDIIPLLDMTKEMETFAVAVEDIADDIEIISFNTEIKSCSVGSEGSDIAVVSSRIRRLSSETAIHAKKVIELLMSIAAAMAQLSSTIDVERTHILAEINDISDHLEGLIHGISDLNGQIFSISAGIAKESGMLSPDIERATRSIRIHTVVDRNVTGVVQTLKDSAARTGPVYHLNGSNSPGPDFRALLSRISALTEYAAAQTASESAVEFF